MVSPKINEICWLIKKKENGSVSIVGFLRDYRNGFFIIGGETGSHYSGHIEKWQEKWNSYLREKYLPVSLAIEKWIINSEWKPPKINKADQEIINKIKNKLM